MSEYYVYLLIDPRSGLPFYVGKGKNKRAWDHFRIVKNGRKSSNPFKDAVIRKIINEGLEPKVLKVKEGLTETDAYDQEEQWIKQLGLRINDTGILTNILTNSRPPALSGNRNGMWGKTHTEEVRAIISEKNKGRFKGKTYEDIYGDRADDIKKHRSDVLKKPKTPEHAVKCRENGLKGAEKIGNQRRGKRWAEIYDKDTIQKMKQARRELTQDEVTSMRINQPHIKRFEVISEDGVVVKATGTKELALIINLSRVTISRMVSHLQEGDSIRYKNTTITRI